MPATAKRMTAPPSARSATMPAPIGGLNTVSAGSSMPPEDCISLYNMVAAEYGLRTRLGSTEWVTTMTGSGNNEVRSVLPFTGPLKDGTKDKLFATTNTGIWDCTSSTASPSKVVTFGTNGSDAGYGISTVFVNLNGDHFLLYCDEANGYYVYTSGTAAWAHVALATSVAWTANTAVSSVTPTRMLANGATYKCTTSGTTATSGTGPAGTGTAISDGTAAWDYEPTISGKDPATFAFVTVWANRVWFVEKDTANAWYTGLSALYGPVTKFAFGTRFRAGGDLRGLFNWTQGGGNSGIQNALVAVSGGGDLVIYQGTDPAQISSFSIKGVWTLGGGGVPAGRRLATDFGGDLLLMSTLGLLPLSRLTDGGSVFDRSQYATQKIANVFGQAAYTGRALKGWQVRLHPQDNTILVNVPNTDGTTYQFVMSLTTKGWSVYRDLPSMLSLEAWNGNLYFGTKDGRLMINTGYLDGVTLANPNTFAPIQFEVLTSFQNLNSQSYKRLNWARPQFISQGGKPGFSVGARFDYDFTDLPTVTTQPTNAGSVWDTGKWDTATWAGDYAPSKDIQGTTGCGVAAAIIVRGTATSRTSLVGIDVSFTAGGVL